MRKNKVKSITKRVNSARVEVLFVVGKELEENIMADVQWNDLNDFNWKFQNYFSGDYALIYAN